MNLDLDLDDHSPRAIAGLFSQLIADGDLAPGDRLPTVRDVAQRLGVSPATVSEAWQAMRRAGLITSRGRAGSYVRDRERQPLSPRMHDLEGSLESLRLDLSRGVPDVDLLPALGPALSRVSQRAAVGYYQQDPVIASLRKVLSNSFADSGARLTVVDGSTDAVDRVLSLLVGYGDRVAVESPGFPPFLDLIDSFGGQPVALAMDQRGVLPESLDHALRLRPKAVIIQPRAQNPTGASMDASRAAELAQVVADHDDRTVIIEDDHSGLICQAAPVSLMHWLPDRVVHVRGFSKSHGPDLRIAAVQGPARLIDQIVARRMLGPGWTSHMVQSILVDLLTDPISSGRVSRARTVYADRQLRMTRALARHGIDVPVHDGVNVWVPVPDERAALTRLAAAGIRAAGGAPFVAPGWTRGDHLRLSLGPLASGFDHVADALASA